MTSTFKSNTMVAVTFGIMLLTSTAFCAMIGDFAPTDGGSEMGLQLLLLLHGYYYYSTGSHIFPP